MNWVHLLRRHTGITQQALATSAGTSQPTIALYESGAKSPTLETLQRLARSVGVDLVISFTSPMTREDLRSLAFHQAVSEQLRRDPAATLKRAKKTLNRLVSQHSGAKALLDQWAQWLNLGIEELIAKILDPGMLAREMRQTTPFAGVLSAHERAQILRKFRKEYGN